MTENQINNLDWWRIVELHHHQINNLEFHITFNNAFLAKNNLFSSIDDTREQMTSGWSFLEKS